MKLNGATEEVLRASEVRRPLSITIAEAFLILILVIYFAKIVTLGMGMFRESSWTGILFSWNMFFFICDIAMMFVTVDSIISLNSRKPKGWKKAVRGAFLLFLFTLFGMLFGSGLSVGSYITLGLEFVIPMVVLVIALMLFPSVRDYYVPPLESRRPLSAWIAFAAFSELYPSGKYRISYGDDGSDDA